MANQNGGGLLGRLTFAPTSERRAAKADRSEKIRKNFLEMLGAQKAFALKDAENPGRNVPKNEKHIYFRNGDRYVIEPRYGRRKVILCEDQDIVATDMKGVILAIDTIAEAVRNRDPDIDKALFEAASIPRKNGEGTGNSPVKEGKK